MARSWMRHLVPAAAILGAVAIAGCASAPKTPAAAATGLPSLQAGEPSGVEVVAVRRLAAGRLLDFRFRVVDPAKASPLLLRGTPARLVHESTGARMDIPETKVGRMRQSTLAPEKDRVYFMLFDAAGRGVSPGDKVTVIVGEHRFEHLTVQ